MATKKINIKKQNLNFEVTSNELKNIITAEDNNIVDIPNDSITEIDQQDFKIHEDTVQQIAAGIKRDGQLSPCIVTPFSDGKYELLAGRHRRRAVILAGLPTTKCIIKNNLDDKQKRLIIINSNLDRNNDYLPSELAFAYKEKVELEGGHDAIKRIAEEVNTSKKKIYRYIRLTYLIKPLLERVDTGNIPLIAAVELSYLPVDDQNKLFDELLNHSSVRITTEAAKSIKVNPRNMQYFLWRSNSSAYNADEEIQNLDTLEQEENQLEYLDDNELTKAPSVDKLSTTETNSDVTDETLQIKNTSFSEESSMIEDLMSVDKKTKDEIIQIFLEQSNIDKLIINKFYSTSEILSYLKEKCISCHVGGSYNKCVYHFKQKFELHYKSKIYYLPYAQLDGAVRNYIRDNYKVEKIISIIQGELNRSNKC